MNKGFVFKKFRSNRFHVDLGDVLLQSQILGPVIVAFDDTEYEIVEF